LVVPVVEVVTTEALAVQGSQIKVTTVAVD
jgi:hypothetical protein